MFRIAEPQPTGRKQKRGKPFNSEAFFDRNFDKIKSIEKRARFKKEIEEAKRLNQKNGRAD